MLCDVYRKSVSPICDNMARYARSHSEWKDAQEHDDSLERAQASAESEMAKVCAGCVMCVGLLFALVALVFFVHVSVLN